MSSPITRRTAAGAVLTALAAATGRAQEERPTIRVGIVGLGSRATSHIAALKLFARVRVTALCDLESDRIALANEALREKAVAFVDYRELLQSEAVDAVVIATPNFLHARMTLEALRAGKDVLVEKPLALSYREARHVVEEARRSGRLLTIGMQRTFAAADTKIVEIAESGALGRILLISLAEFRGDWNPNTWRYVDPQTGEAVSWRHRAALMGSALLEFSIHSFGLVHSILKSPVVRASSTGGAMRYKDRDTYDLISVAAEFRSGARLQHSFCGFAHGAGSHLTVVGEDGVLSFDGRTLRVRAGQDRPLEIEPRDAESPDVLMYKDFFSSIRNRRQPFVTLEHALEASRIAYLADLSLEEKRPVTDRDLLV